MAPVYAVFQEGICRHLCIGIFSTETLALAAANKAAWTDKDSYHQYDVCPFEMDSFYGEQPSVFSVSKPGRTLGRDARHFPATVVAAVEP